MVRFRRLLTVLTSVIVCHCLSTTARVLLLYLSSSTCSKNFCSFLQLTSQLPLFKPLLQFIHIVPRESGTLDRYIIHLNSFVAAYDSTALAGKVIILTRESDLSHPTPSSWRLQRTNSIPFQTRLLQYPLAIMRCATTTPRRMHHDLSWIKHHTSHHISAFELGSRRFGSIAGLSSFFSCFFGP